MAHSLLAPTDVMANQRNDDDLICSCRHPACTITTLWRRASPAHAAQSPVPEALPFDLSDTVVTDTAGYKVPAPPPVLLPAPREIPRRVA
jgi:hypothetical protein